MQIPARFAGQRHVLEGLYVHANQKTGKRATRGRGKGQPEDGDKGNQRTGTRATRGRGKGQPEDGEKGNQRTGKRATRGRGKGQPEDGGKGNQRAGQPENRDKISTPTRRPITLLETPPPPPQAYSVILISYCGRSPPKEDMKLQLSYSSQGLVS